MDVFDKYKKFKMKYDFLSQVDENDKTIKDVRDFIKEVTKWRSSKSNFKDCVI